MGIVGDKTPIRSVVGAIVLAVIMAQPAVAQGQRTPRQVSDQLTRICGKAGHSPQGLKACAEKMSALCRKQRIDPKSQRCWQWVLGEDDNKRLDMRALKR